MKFPDFSPDFSSRGKQRLRGIHRYGQQSLFHINEKKGEARCCSKPGFMQVLSKVDVMKFVLIITNFHHHLYYEIRP